MRTLLFVVLLTAGLPRPSSEVPTRQELVRSLRRGGPVVIVYGRRDAAAGRSLAEEARRFVSRRSDSVRLLEASRATREDVSRGNVVLVGTPSDNPWIRDLLPELPVSIDRDGIHLLGETYSDPADSLQLLYPNPLHLTSALLLLTGNEERGVVDAVEHRRRGDLQLRRSGKTLLIGRFRDDGSVDRTLLREFFWPDSPALVTEHFRFFSHGTDVETLQAEGSTLEALRRKVEALFGPLPDERQDLHVYPSLEEKGLVTENTRTAHFDGGDLHVVLGVDDRPERRVAEKLLEEESLASTVLSRGLAVVLTNDAPTLDRLDETARALSSTSLPPHLDALEGESPYVVRALTASFARFVLRERGASAFLSSTALDRPLERRWLRLLDDAKPRTSRVPPLPASFQRGFTFAHEGFDIENGYLSRRSEQSLERLEELGIDAVAIVPYAFLGSPTDVSLSVPDRAGAETDEDVVSAIRRAKSRGMTVLLKPQIWLRRSWPGAIEPRNAEDEERFFQEYGRWMRHYGLMAESEGVELLSIGTELSKLTEGRRDRWETLISDLRSIYGGKLVYAANWGREVEAVDFWSLLDFIGVDFYYPLSEDETASDDTLRRGFERALEGLRTLSRRYEKPVLLTEIGYASTRNAWKEPHASDQESVVSLEHQARAYEIAFEAISHETGWIRGMYWWKWPSDLEMGHRSHTGFTPAGKPAEDVVRRWYGGRLQ